MDDGPLLFLLVCVALTLLAVGVGAYKGGYEDGRQEQCEWANPEATRCIMDPDSDFYVPVTIVVKEG